MQPVKIEVDVLLGGDTIHSLTLPVLLYQDPIGQKYNITGTGGKGLWSQYRREGVILFLTSSPPSWSSE